MKKHTFVLNGLEYTIEQSLSGDYCRLLYKDITIIDDSACDDFYGDPEDLIDVFKSYMEEEVSKRAPWWTLMGAIYEWGSDPSLIENEEEAKFLSGIIEDSSEFTKVTDPTKIDDLKSLLDLDDHECRCIYEFVDVSAGSLCLDEDWSY